MKKQERVVTWAGGYFDIPIIISRCLKYNIDFPLHKEIQHVDLWKTSKGKLCMHSNRLETVCEYLGIPSKGHRMNPDVWLGALSGKKKDLDWIFTHNVEDVDSTMAVFEKLLPYIPSLKGSI
jgi:uncharacterized protein YprB with RNaseH-like and TPR domain